MPGVSRSESEACDAERFGDDADNDMKKLPRPGGTFV